MKIKYADKRNDPVILKNEFKMKSINNESLKGTISLINIKEITHPVVVLRPNGNKECVLDLEYKWMGIYPKNEKYCITVMYDNNWNLLQWYFDIANDIGNDESGIPYIYDLYLDIVVLPNGEYYMLDEDELKQALVKEDISENEYKLAYDMAQKIFQNLESHFNQLVNFTKFCQKRLK